MSIKWKWNIHTGDTATSECGRWVITKICAEKFEIWDNIEKEVIGVFKTIKDAFEEINNKIKSDI